MTSASRRSTPITVCPAAASFSAAWCPIPDADPVTAYTPTTHPPQSVLKCRYTYTCAVGVLQLPECTDGQCLEPRPEAQGGVAGVQHHTRCEVVAGLRLQVTQATEVRAGDAGGGLHLDAGDPAVVGLQDRVDLDAVLRAVVVQADLFGGPSQLSRKLHQHEAFQERTDRRAGQLAQSTPALTQ